MLHWEEINNQLHDIIVALIQEVLLWLECHKTGHSLQHGHISAFMHFFFWGSKEPVEILHLWWCIFDSRSYPLPISATMSSIRSTSSFPFDSSATADCTSPCWCHKMLFNINAFLARLADISYSNNILLFSNLLHGQLASWWPPTKANFKNYLVIWTHSIECLLVSLNSSYIYSRSSAIFNTKQMKA
jgi:hypothetical protein